MDPSSPWEKKKDVRPLTRSGRCMGMGKPWETVRSGSSGRFQVASLSWLTPSCLLGSTVAWTSASASPTRVGTSRPRTGGQAGAVGRDERRCGFFGTEVRALRGQCQNFRCEFGGGPLISFDGMKMDEDGMCSCKNRLS